MLGKNVIINSKKIIPLFLGLIQLLQKKKTYAITRIKVRLKIFLMLPTIITIKKIIIQKTRQNQNICCSFDDIYIYDYKFGDKY